MSSAPPMHGPAEPPAMGAAFQRATASTLASSSGSAPPALAPSPVSHGLSSSSLRARAKTIMDSLAQIDKRYLRADGSYPPEIVPVITALQAQLVGIQHEAQARATSAAAAAAAAAAPAAPTASVLVPPLALPLSPGSLIAPVFTTSRPHSLTPPLPASPPPRFPPPPVEAAGGAHLSPAPAAAAAGPTSPGGFLPPSPPSRSQHQQQHQQQWRPQAGPRLRSPHAPRVHTHASGSPHSHAQSQHPYLSYPNPGSGLAAAGPSATAAHGHRHEHRLSAQAPALRPASPPGPGGRGSRSGRGGGPDNSGGPSGSGSGGGGGGGRAHGVPPAPPPQWPAWPDAAAPTTVAHSSSSSSGGGGGGGSFGVRRLAAASSAVQKDIASTLHAIHSQLAVLRAASPPPAAPTHTYAHVQAPGPRPRPPWVPPLSPLPSVSAGAPLPLPSATGSPRPLSPWRPQQHQQHHQQLQQLAASAGYDDGEGGGGGGGGGHCPHCAAPGTHADAGTNTTAAVAYSVSPGRSGRLRVRPGSPLSLSPRPASASQGLPSGALYPPRRDAHAHCAHAHAHGHHGHADGSPRPQMGGGGHSFGPGYGRHASTSPFASPRHPGGGSGTGAGAGGYTAVGTSPFATPRRPASARPGSVTGARSARCEACGAVTARGHAQQQQHGGVGHCLSCGYCAAVADGDANGDAAVTDAGAGAGGCGCSCPCHTPACLLPSGQCVFAVAALPPPLPPQPPHTAKAPGSSKSARTGSSSSGGSGAWGRADAVLDSPFVQWMASLPPDAAADTQAPAATSAAAAAAGACTQCVSSVRCGARAGGGGETPLTAAQSTAVRRALRRALEDRRALTAQLAAAEAKAATAAVAASAAAGEGGSATAMNVLLQLGHAEGEGSTTARSRPMPVTAHDMADEIDYLRQQVDEGIDAVTALQRKLFSVQAEAKRAKAKAASVEGNVDKDKWALLARIDEVEEEKRLLEESLRLMRYTVDAAEQGANDEAGVGRLLRSDLAASNGNVMALHQHMAQLQTQLRSDVARGGREKLRMAAAKYLSVWYRDRYRTGLDAAVARAMEGGVNGGGQKDADAAVRARVLQEGLATVFNDGDASGYASARKQKQPQLQQQDGALAAVEQAGVPADMLRTAQAEITRLETALINREILLREAGDENGRLAAELAAAKAEALRAKAKGQLSLAEIANDDASLKSAHQQLTRVLVDSFHGDYIGARNNRAVLQHVYSKQETLVAFADVVTVVDSKNRHQQRVLVVTDKGVYVLRGNDVEAYVLIGNLTHLSVSRFAADLLIIHHQARHDILLLSPKRSEALFCISLQFLRLRGRTMPVQCSERLLVCDDGSHHREVAVPATQSIRTSDSTLVATQYS